MLGVRHLRAPLRCAGGLDSTLSRLFPTVLLDGGLPRATIDTDEEQDQHELALADIT
jgi:hypothetical protein